MTETARLRLPEIAAAQAQKHVTHNEALVYLDTLVQASVKDKDLTAPPGSPTEGDCYIVAGSGGSASGAWISWEKRIVRFQDGQWASFLPGAGSGIGWTCWVQDEQTLYTFDGTNWVNALRGKTGGGISIQYVFSTTTADADPGNGVLRLDQATQNTATAIRADLLDAGGADWSAALASLADSTSTVKGHVRLFSVADPAKWLLFTVSAVASPTGYKNIAVANVASSAASPFVNGDAVVLAFSRSGDKGSAGTNGANGTNGLDGTNAGLRWSFATSTSMADPSNGNLRANNATLASVTQLALSANTAESGNPSALGYLQTFDDSTNTLKGYLLIKKVAAPQNFRVYSIASLTDNTTWIQLSVAHVAGNGSFSASDVLSLEFSRAGDAGAGGGSVPADLDVLLAELALGLADALNVAQFLGSSGNRVADSFDAVTYVDTANSSNLDTSSAGLLKPTGGSGTAHSSSNPSSSQSYGGNIYINKDSVVTNGTVVHSLGTYQTSAKTVYCYIVKRNSATSYDIVAATGAQSHPGGGWASFNLPSDYTVPGSGTYYVGIGFATASADYYTPGGRATITGQSQSVATGYTAAETVDICPSVRWTESALMNNMTALSTSFSASAAPSSMKLVARTKFIDAITLGTDLTFEVSRDGGTTWSACTMNDRFTSNSLHVLESNSTSVSGQPSGMSVKWRVKSLNNKSLELHDMYVYWS